MVTIDAKFLKPLVLIDLFILNMTICAKKSFIKKKVINNF